MPLGFEPARSLTPGEAAALATRTHPTPSGDVTRIPTVVAGMPVIAAVPDGNTDSNRVYVIGLDQLADGLP